MDTYNGNQPCAIYSMILVAVGCNSVGVRSSQKYTWSDRSFVFCGSGIFIVWSVFQQWLTVLEYSGNIQCNANSAKYQALQLNPGHFYTADLVVVSHGGPQSFTNIQYTSEIPQFTLWYTREAQPSLYMVILISTRSLYLFSKNLWKEYQRNILLTSCYSTSLNQDLQVHVCLMEALRYFENIPFALTSYQQTREPPL